MITNPNAPTAITPAILATMDAGLADLRAGCAELPTADAALLRRAAKMGLKSETFSREAIELAKQNAELCPAGLDLEQAERAMAVRDALLSRYLQARQLAETLEVAMQVCGVDAFDAARTAYKSMKANCRDAALMELIDHLGRNFRTKRSDGTPPEAESRMEAPGLSRSSDGNNSFDESSGAAATGSSTSNRVRSPKTRSLPMAQRARGASMNVASDQRSFQKTAGGRPSALPQQGETWSNAQSPRMQFVSPHRRPRIYWAALHRTSCGLSSGSTQQE